MIRKKNKDDEIPLTVSRSTILQETKARFDTLLKATRGQENEEKKNAKKLKKIPSKVELLQEVKPYRKRSKQKLSTSTQMLVNTEDISSSSESNEDKLEDIPQLEANPSSVEVKEFTSVSSSDEILPSLQTEASSHRFSTKTTVLIHSNSSSLDLPSNSNSPQKDIRIPQKIHSIRDESRETTSSRVSSPESVMTAIEAASPIRSLEGSSPEKTSIRETEQYELKPLKAFSASYEEIDETSLSKNEIDASADPNAKGMENAASYEEILEDSQVAHVPERKESENNQGMSYESLHIEQKAKQNKKQRMQISHQRRRTKDAIENTDSSSNDSEEIPDKQKRHGGHARKKAKSSSARDPYEQTSVQYTYEKVIGITLYRCDSLQIDSLIRHPMVRVHILDTVTGEYLKKSDPSRDVSFFQESSKINYIQPLTSQPCNFLDPRSLTPIWEETLFFNEDIKHILQPNSSIIILFEVLDCVPIDTAVAQYDKLGSECGWHRIAWAFLKPCGPNNIINIDKKLRLQLYKPRSDKTLRSQTACDKCDVYRWWSKGGWIQYPSTLHVTLHSLPIPSEAAPAVRSYFALQPEQSTISPGISDDEKVDSQDRNSTRGITALSDLADGVTWSRLPSQLCKIPNEKELNLQSGLNGSFSIKYSHRGHYLAVTASNQSVHNIIVYRIPDGSEVYRFLGHPGLIYSLDWSSNDELLLSASADCTACIWSVKSNRYAPKQMLPHPSFVYCAVFLPTNPLILVTGCCDHVIRIWSCSSETSKFELQQELNGHEGYVSTICSNPNGTLFSGDSVGQIIIWERTETASWSQLRVLAVRELHGIILSHLVLHPGGKRLLVLARDSLLRMVDIGTGVAIQWFKGALNQRIHSKACITPCGGLVFAPSEDGTFYVWNADTGLLLASFTALFNAVANQSQLGFGQKSVMSTTILGGAVEYHPFDHMVAFAVYGVHVPTIICKFKRESSGNSIGLQLKRGKYEEPAEAESLNGVQQADTFGKTALLVSNVKTLIRAQKNENNSKKNEGSYADDQSISISTHANDGLIKQESHHLSYIIKQLDYVLQLSRMSKEDQLDVVTAQPASPRSPAISANSSYSADVNEGRIRVQEITSVHAAKHAVTNFTLYHTNADMQISKSPEASQIQSDKDNFSSPSILAHSPAKVQYVQEKQPPRPAPRQKRSRPIRVERQQSAADLSTTDTSLLSSENEDSRKTILVKHHSLLSHENEISPRKSNPKLPLDKSFFRQRGTLVSSFDSDSDIQSSLKEQ